MVTNFVGTVGALNECIKGQKVALGLRPFSVVLDPSNNVDGFLANGPSALG